MFWLGLVLFSVEVCPIIFADFFQTGRLLRPKWISRYIVFHFNCFFLFYIFQLCLFSTYYARHLNNAIPSLLFCIYAERTTQYRHTNWLQPGHVYSKHLYVNKKLEARICYPKWVIGLFILSKFRQAQQAYV